jgi:outer membrane lipoprotein carrier protein
MTLALALALLAAASPDPGPVLKKLETAGRALKTLKADFSETKVLVLLDEKQETQGRVFLQVPGRLRWDYLAPQPGVMVIRDGRFERYVPQTKQVFRGPARGEADLLVGFGPGAADLAAKYEVTLLPREEVAGKDAYVLDLKPRQPGLFSGIRLWVDDDKFIPVQTRLTEPTGDHTTIRFLNVVVNATLPPAAFDLRLPSDVVEVK